MEICSSCTYSTTAPKKESATPAVNPFVRQTFGDANKHQKLTLGDQASLERKKKCLPVYIVFFFFNLVSASNLYGPLRIKFDPESMSHATFLSRYRNNFH